jgi:hypothetical protein
MDTLDKILKAQPTPIHLRLKKGEFELVIVTEYPHGYDVAHRYICDSLDDAFAKATGNPLSVTDTPYAWRIYRFGQVAIAQSPNLHRWLPDDTLEIQNKLVEMTRDRDEWRDSCKLANKRFESNDHAMKENFRLREMLQNVLGLRSWLGIQLLKKDIEKLLKKEETNG